MCGAPHTDLPRPVVPSCVAQRSANQYANGGNQNCGNVMTGRSTTRLHAPPGGKSSFSIGMKGAPSDVTGKIGSMGNRPAPRRQQQQAKPVQHQQQAPAQAQQQQQSQPKAGTSANRYANGANQNCGNVITDRPTSRVLKPPGGGSSGPLW